MPAERGASLGIPKPLALDIDRFIAEHPEFGIKHRNDFAARAIGDLLNELRHEVYFRLIMDAYKQGRTGPLEELRKSGFKL